MFQLLPCAASGAQAAESQVTRSFCSSPAEPREVQKAMPWPGAGGWDWLTGMESRSCYSSGCHKAAFKGTLPGRGHSADSWHLLGFSGLNSQKAKQYFKASSCNVKGSDGQPEHGWGNSQKGAELSVVCHSKCTCLPFHPCVVGEDSLAEAGPSVTTEIPGFGISSGSPSSGSRQGQWPSSGTGTISNSAVYSLMQLQPLFWALWVTPLWNEGSEGLRKLWESKK